MIAEGKQSQILHAACVFLADLSLLLQPVSSPSHSCFSGLVRAMSLRLCLDLQFPVDFIIMAFFKTDITYHARNCRGVGE